jgi:Clp amino terminal domain, pathogenicity island component
VVTRFTAVDGEGHPLDIDIYGGDPPEGQLLSRLWRFVWIRRSPLDLWALTATSLVPRVLVGERLTDGYRKVVNRAVAEAWVLHHDHVGTGHLLLALVGIDGEPAAETLRSLGVSLETARRCVSEQSAQPSPGQLAPGQQRADLTGFTENARKAMESVAFEAMRRRDPYIGTEHLLLRLVDRDNTAVRVLAQLGCDPAVIRDLLRR